MGNRPIYFPDDPNTLRYIQHIKKLGKGKFSPMIVKAMIEYVDRHIVLQQEKLESFRPPIYDKLDILHERFVHNNKERFGTWSECLEVNDLVTQETIDYSKEKGWWSRIDEIPNWKEIWRK